MYKAHAALTEADRSDDPKDNEPQQHTGDVAQQEDEDQTDHHGEHQTTATTPTHTYCVLTRMTVGSYCCDLYNSLMGQISFIFPQVHKST